MQVYSAYSDESGINANDPYTSIAVVSGEKDILDCLRDKLADIVSANNIKEVKFLKVNSYVSTITQAARQFLKCTLNEFACNQRVRVDILTMDNQAMDNQAYYAPLDYSSKPELEHMYYCVVSHIVRQWRNTQWNFYPDVNSKINWNEIILFLNMTRLHKKKIRNPLLIDLMFADNPRFQFNEIKQLSSVKEPLIQLADLFAGIARFSHEKNTKCAQWVTTRKGKEQQELPLNIKNRANSINLAEQCRYEIIRELYNLCGKHRLWVSIKSRQHLWTRKPNYPINFWDFQFNK